MFSFSAADLDLGPLRKRKLTLLVGKLDWGLNTQFMVNSSSPSL
jgi:hypothetical protein